MLFGCRERYAGLATLGLSENENHEIEESSDTYRWIHGLLIGFATPSRRGRNGAHKECRSRRGSPPVVCSPCTAQVTNVEHHEEVSCTGRIALAGRFLPLWKMYDLSANIRRVWSSDPL